MQSRTIINTKLVNFHIKNVSFFFSPSPPAQTTQTNRPAQCRNAGEVYRARGVSFTLAPGTQVLTEQAMQPLEVLLNRMPGSDVLPKASTGFNYRCWKPTATANWPRC